MVGWVYILYTYYYTWMVGMGILRQQIPSICLTSDHFSLTGGGQL